MQKIYLIALLILISGCAENKKFLEFPVKTAYVVDISYNQCYKFTLIDTENIKWKLQEIMPLKECDGIFGTKGADSSLMFEWVKEAIAEIKYLYKRKCAK